MNKRIKRGWGRTRVEAGSGSYRGSSSQFITPRTDAKSGKVRTIVGKELDDIIKAYERKAKLGMGGAGVVPIGRGLGFKRGK